jgi:hypothetical protein
MSDTTYFIWCIVKGDTSLFHVNALPTICIAELKDLIKEQRKNGLLRGVFAKDLNLWKVRMTLVVIRSDIMGDTTLAFGGYPYRAR